MEKKVFALIVGPCTSGSVKRSLGEPYLVALVVVRSCHIRKGYSSRTYLAMMVLDSRWASPNQGNRSSATGLR